MTTSGSQTDRPAARRVAAARVAAALAVLVAVFVGWRLFWFLTDDAFIAFRYASNHLLGHGLVWNPAPFLPVEGYTSLLWVVLLELVWRLTGVEPPAAANWISLLLGYATLFLACRFVARMQLPGALDRRRALLLSLVLLLTITNRTFLTWLSSGLETSLFNLCVVWWVFCALTPAAGRGRWWPLSFTLSNAAIALARPDGLLFYAGALVILALAYVERRRVTEPPGNASRLAALVPLLVVPGHLVWRRLTYEAWLPNTYYAKHVAAWPASGGRYLGSFLLEYGVWLWVLILLVAVWTGLRRGGLRAAIPGRDHAGTVVTLAVVAAHFLYYTLVIGGDHFEYRVYSHLVPLYPVGALWLLARISSRAWVAPGALALFLLVSLPIPWVHWNETRGLTTRKETHVLIRPVAPLFPAVVRPVVGWWDTLQAWLISHHVGMRHQEHKIFYEDQVQKWPGRDEGRRVRWPDRAVLVSLTVGVPGWVLPEVAVIDVLGLNDRVIARSPVRPGARRQMAHDRLPPAGYVECFRPNVRIVGGRIRVRPRPTPLGDDDIRACEDRRWF